MIVAVDFCEQIRKSLLAMVVAIAIAAPVMVPAMVSRIETQTHRAIAAVMMVLERHSKHQRHHHQERYQATVPFHKR